MWWCHVCVLLYKASWAEGTCHPTTHQPYWERTYLFTWFIFCITQKTYGKMEAHFDEYEHWNFDHEKHMFSGRSGKGRTKKEASLNTNHFDQSGHTRKLVTKFSNTHHRRTRTESKWTRRFVCLYAKLAQYRIDQLIELCLKILCRLRNVSIRTNNQAFPRSNRKIYVYQCLLC
jgi:hypothetical protein